ncbi:MAG: GNAT family N-acetyltransferase [bacterium]|nr:GNAT family N-acetyltransferase [bacterium]
MLEIKKLEDEVTVKRVGDFLTGPDAFNYQWSAADKYLLNQSLRRSLIEENHQYWYIHDKEIVIGAIGVRENKNLNGGYEMDDDYLAVHDRYRHQHLASRLLAEVESFVKNKEGRYIHILTYDTEAYQAARRLYEKHAYRVVAIIPNYYVEGEGRVDYFKEM